MSGASEKATAACVITFREGDDAARKHNLIAVLQWLSQWPDLPVVLVEQDAKPSLDDNLPHPNVHYQFVYNPGPFNKSWGLNVGARRTHAAWLLFHDGDIILGAALNDALAARQAGYHAISPFSRMVDLDPAESEKVRAGAFDWLPDRPDPNVSDRQVKGEFMPLAGASLLISRSAYAAVGGWDERFVGWGCEDDALSDLLRRAQVPTIELNSRAAAHLYHKRGPARTVDQPNYASNLQVLHSYSTLSDAELARSAAVRRALNGRAEKYQARV